MTILSEYIRIESELKDLQARLQEMESNDAFKRELEFKQKMESLLTQFNKEASDIIEILDPNGEIRASNNQNISNNLQTLNGSSRRKRKLKIYKNPFTAEIIETRGGNHKQLKAWKEEYGHDKVETWLLES